MELPSVDPPAKKTLDSIPRDESTRRKVTDIIDHQFDLEIYLKQKELVTIKQEIAKAESILADIKQAVENETIAASMPEAAHYTRRSAMYYHGGSQALLNQNTPPPTAPKRKIYRTSDKVKVYGRRQDGVYVSLSCPACHREDFANQQGFLNHCRISHNLEFGPYEQIMLQCGTPVDESEVPEDHPARLRPVLNLTPVPKQPQKKIERPSIKVFEEDVDMELDNEKRASSAARTTEYSDLSSNIETASIHTQKENTIAPKDNTIVAKENAIAPKDNTIVAKDNASAAKDTTIAAKDNATTSKDNAPVLEDTDTVVKENTQVLENTSVEKAENEVPQVESLAAAVVPAEAGSRFYIKRSIIVGNVSKYIVPERRDPSLKQFTHKWMIYVVEPPQSKEKISTFITCVRFYLHPSYKPHDVVDVTEPPFKLTRFGWGEFPIRIQLFFVDKRRNKAVDLIHHLRLDNSHSGKQLLGGERMIEIELDRNTDFKDTSSRPSAPGSPPSTPMRDTESPAVMAVKQKMSLLNGLLKECVRKLPIIRANTHGLTLPYTCAPSYKMFFKWSIGKRKGLEWHRARILRIETQKRAFDTNDNVLRMAAEALGTKDVVIWCRNNKYTPSKSEQTEEIKNLDKALGYCKFCGYLRDEHDQTDDDSCPQRPKGWSSRKRNGGINSISNVTHLLNQFEMGWDEVKEADEEMDIDVDVDQRTAGQTNKEKDTSERVKRWALESDVMDVANERSLDWIWSVVGQLRLKSVIANDMLLAKDGNLQGPTSDFDLAAAMSQRLVVGNVLTQATRIFLKRLLDKTVNISRKQDNATDKSTRMIVPYHVYQAAQQTQEFDFLTNQYMGPEENS